MAFKSLEMGFNVGGNFILPYIDFSMLAPLIGSLLISLIYKKKK